MTLGVLKEASPECRVAITPDSIPALKKMGFDRILLESGAGENAFFPNEQYSALGVEIVSRSAVQESSDIILSVHAPEDLNAFKSGQVLAGQWNPLSRQHLAAEANSKQLTVFSLDLAPRTTRAQALDVLSSMATAAGYRAVLLAATLFPGFFPMLVTAAGSIKPARVLILGAGVAGLQAISTARRLGAVVEAFDVRTAAGEEVRSLGATFISVEGAKDDKAAGGYAVEQTEEYKQKQAQLVHEHALKADIVICTAQIPGRKAPLLLQEQTVQQMKAGSVIIDLAANSGGNCALTQNRQTIQVNGVTIVGESDLPSGIPGDASKMFAKNLVNFLPLILKDQNFHLNMEDDIVAHTCVTHAGQIISERLKQFMGAAV